MSKALYDTFDDEFAKRSIPEKFTVDDFEPDMSVLPTDMHGTKQESTIGEVFETCKVAGVRTKHQVLAALVEEVGELATEVNAQVGFSRKPMGVDGILGEAVDVVLCALDLVFVDWEGQELERLERILNETITRKLAKWKTKQQLS